MQANLYDASLRLMEISNLLHDLSRDLELATCSTCPGVETEPLRKIADSIDLEARNFRYMGL